MSATVPLTLGRQGLEHTLNREPGHVPLAPLDLVFDRVAVRQPVPDLDSEVVDLGIAAAPGRHGILDPHPLYDEPVHQDGGRLGDLRGDPRLASKIARAAASLIACSYTRVAKPLIGWKTVSLRLSM